MRGRTAPHQRVTPCLVVTVAVFVLLGCTTIARYDQVAIQRGERTQISDAGEDGLESAVHHSLHIEWHCLWIHHLRKTRVLHHLRVDAIAVSARLKHDVREQYRLTGLGFNPTRER
jgi:hypothetical protein